MRIAMTGFDYCGQYATAPPPPHELAWLPFAPTLAEMFAYHDLTPEWADVFVTVLAESTPLPNDFETCPCPTVGILVDWELNADALLSVAPAYDFLFTDASGVDVLNRLFKRGKVREFCPVHNFQRIGRLLQEADMPIPPLADRSIDILFVGNTHPEERFAHRVEALKWLRESELWKQTHVVLASGVSRDEYRRLLCDSKLVFNPPASALQMGVNARNFEAGACGCVVIGDTDNKGLRGLFADNEMLWVNDKNKEERIGQALSAIAECQAVADRLREKVSQPLMPRLIAALDDAIGGHYVSFLYKDSTRRTRTVQERITSLLTAFPNWGNPPQRSFEAVKMASELLFDTQPFLPPAFVAAVYADLWKEREASEEKQAYFQKYPLWMPRGFFERAVDAQPYDAFTLYQFARYLHLDGRVTWNGDGDKAAAVGYRVALEALTPHPDKLRLPPFLSPIRTQGMDADRVFAGQVNSTRITHPTSVQDDFLWEWDSRAAAKLLKARLTALLEEPAKG